MFAPKKRKYVYAFDNFDDLENNAEEEFVLDTPDRVNIPGVPSIHTRNGVMEQLVKTIDANGAFNSFVAGSIVYECYKTGFTNTNQIMDTFVTENYGRIRSIVTPNLRQFAEENFYSKLSFGNLLSGKVAIRANANTKSHMEDLSIQVSMNKVCGSAANLTRAYFYPSFEPFSGKQIVIGFIPFSSEDPSHVVLKRVLVSILSKACTNQEEISDHWVVSEYGEVGQKRIFPMGFYKELQVLCAEFFGLHHQVLKTVWNESYRSLSFLASFPDSLRQTRFKKLQLAREAFETRSFHHYFKEALRELRYGSFAPLQNGETDRRFVPRHRITRKADNVPICGEGHRNITKETAGNAESHQEMDEMNENDFSDKTTEEKHFANSSTQLVHSASPLERNVKVQNDDAKGTGHPYKARERQGRKMQK